MKKVLWFRRDLRIKDNPLFSSADENALPVFVFDKDILSEFEKTDPRVTFIFDKVIELKTNLKKKGMDLAILYGYAPDIFRYLKKEGFSKVIFSQDYTKSAIERDIKVSEIIDTTTIQDNFLFHPSEIKKNDGTPYKMFTPFYKTAADKIDESNLIKFPFTYSKVSEFNYDKLHIIENNEIFNKPLSIENIGFVKNYVDNFAADKSPEYLCKRLKNLINNYESNREYPVLDENYHLGVHLRFGTISIREVARFIKTLNEEDFQTETFMKQLFWREFFNSVLYNFPHSEFENFKDAKIPWENDTELFEHWKNGTTGVPIVDAAMRQLNETGYMHNRLRMIVSSFLTKDLHTDWRWGEEYFKHKLFDYEASSNIGSWQWAAGTGCDAQPYFRVFNPYRQAEKFDKKAEFIKKWVPELNNLQAREIHSENKLFEMKVKNYPNPVCRHKAEARKSIELFRKNFKSR